jgi:betaine-aldehyde dehydrogenase
MTRQARLWINGGPEPIQGRDRFPSIDPARGIQLGTVADATVADGEASIAAARRAFDHSTWRQSPMLRATVLLAFADRLERAGPEIAALLTAENGKLLRQSQHEIAIAVSELRYYAGLARNLFGRTIELAPGLHSLLQREAAGVAGIIVPWNAPVILLIRSLAPALAAGCTAVIKTAPQTALVSDAVLECLLGIDGLPPGVCNALSESGSAIAELLVDSRHVDVISYTGSTGVGRRIIVASAATMKRLNLELGGSAPCVIFDDADLDAAVAGLVSAGLVMSGQQCVAANRLLVHEKLSAEAAERFISAIQSVRVGPGDEPTSDMGPMIDLANRDRMLRLATTASTHAELLVEPRIPDSPALARGAFITPGLLRVRDRSAKFLQEEVFGPLLSLDTFQDDEEAIHLANGTPYGLAASVWSRNLARCQRAASRIRSGTVWINSHGRLLPETETGGYKQSGLGRLHGVEGLNDFMQTKHTQWQL